MNLLLVFLFMANADSTHAKPAFSAKTPAFKYGEWIPSKYTCMGKDISPRIVFKNVPKNAKSIAIIADDPDAPMGTWVHWVIYNIPPDSEHIPEAFPKKMKVGKICQGKNDFGKYGYGGPCPPGGVHRYFFKIYILDTVFECQKKMDKETLLKLMKGHIIAQDTIMGRFGKVKM